MTHSVAPGLDSALAARQRAHERACRAAERIARDIATGVTPAADDIQEYRRRAAARQYADAVLQAEADKVAAAS